MSEYYKKLKDPRWQKRRLEILDKNNFTCEMCQSTKRTLHVHHKGYIKGYEPWDYADGSLMCLCEKCHEWVEAKVKKITAMVGWSHWWELEKLDQLVSVLTGNAIAVENSQLPEGVSIADPRDWGDEDDGEPREIKL